jgi:SAM-dependent methyltransferase
VLAVDLSLSSLSYAIRKTREIGLENIEYGQGDLTELASLGRTFDVIDASGVLHHLAEPFAGWEILLTLLRPQGIMAIGLYSELGRREIVAAQQFARNGGGRPAPDNIRRCRRDLMATPLHSIAKFHDFFTTSECRDLLFHVEEHRCTIPQIKSFMDAHGLKLIGFELPATIKEAYRHRFPEDPSMTDLDRWRQFEIERPETFRAMYQLWMVRPGENGAAAAASRREERDA